MANPKQAALTSSEAKNEGCSTNVKRKESGQFLDVTSKEITNSQNPAQVSLRPNNEGKPEDEIKECDDTDSERMPYDEFFQLHLNPAGKDPTSKHNIFSEKHPLISNAKTESFDFICGAGDLSFASKGLQKLKESAGNSTFSTKSFNSLKVANKLHDVLVSLKGEILQLNRKFQTLSEVNELQDKTISQSQQGEDTSLVNACEEQIAEFHSIMTGLSEKLDEQENPKTSDDAGGIHGGQEVDKNIPIESIDVQNEQNPNQNSDSHADTQIVELQELQHQLASKEAEINYLQVALMTMQAEFEKTRHIFKFDTTLKPLSTGCDNQVPVLKVAERIKLKTMDKQVTGYQISNLGVTRTEVAEHLVSDLSENCDIQELKEKHELEVETERLNARLEHLRSQNSLLQLNFDESKAQCSRLSILIGKYESNIIALKQALDKSEEMIEVYRAIREISKKSPRHTAVPEEKQLLNKLAKLSSEHSSIKSTVVKLESHILEPVAKHPESLTDARKLDIETAVLMQELMALREEKAELKAQLFRLEKEREQLELKLFSQQLQFQAQLNSQSAIDDNVSESEFKKNKTEIRLRERLKEVALMLERVSRNAELKNQQANEHVNQLKTVNSVLAHSLEKCNQKLQTRVRKIETQMLSMAERHASQVSNLKQNIVSLEDKLVLYENTIRSLEGELEVCKKSCS